MKKINTNVNDTLIINKSKFITFLYNLNSLEEIDVLLNNIKSEYKDATHYCYSYIFDNVKRFNDDSEPNGTAGMPILNVLENNDLNYVLCIVVRYFGGIKLGAGGLVRAYTKSVTNCLKLTNIVDIKEGYKIELLFNYDQNKVIDLLLKNEVILDKEYNDLIKYNIILNKDNFELINKLEISCIRVSIKEIVKY